MKCSPALVTVAVVTAAWLGSGAAAAVPGGPFASRAAYSVGPNLFQVSAADLDGDGRRDLVGLDPTDQSVIALLNRGGGGLADPVRSSGVPGVAFAVGDVNGDGRLDMMTVDGTRAYELLGRGDGTFAAPRPVSAGPKARQVALADLNGDASLDLITAAGYPRRQIRVRYGHGDGTFGPGTDIPWDRTNPSGIVVADLNADHRPDIVVSSLEDRVVAFLQEPDGSWLQRDTHTKVCGPDYLSARDMNADGKTDLVVSADFCTPGVEVLLGNGDGTFATQQVYPSRVIQWTQGSLAVGDFNGDGWFDVAEGPSLGKQLAVRLGQPGGRLGGELTYQVDATPGPCTGCGDVVSIAAADLDGDGREDLAASVRAEHQVIVLLTRGRTGAAGRGH